MPQNMYDEICQIIEENNFSSVSDYIRQTIRLWKSQDTNLGKDETLLEREYRLSRMKKGFRKMNADATSSN